jgi:iron complex outermembrane recepter protein
MRSAPRDLWTSRRAGYTPVSMRGGGSHAILHQCRPALHFGEVLRVKYNATVSAAVAAILGAQAGAGWTQSAPPTAEAAASDQLMEVVVTANRREQNLEDVPITIQALTAETLTELNVQTFEDVLKYLPNVNEASQGPGQGNIIMRGLGTATGSIQGSGVVGSFPNAAVYLDDQAGQLPARNLDIYAADMERIEVLEGPQGTLFGSGAQAGVLRYITNKPKLDVTEGNVNAGYAETYNGDPSTSVNATLNLPLIKDTLAVRAVIYDDSRGGYINNVAGTFTRSPTDKGIIDYFGGVVPAGSPPLNNSGSVQNACNPVAYEGFRLSALYKINEDWNALLTQSNQSMTADGVFFETPTNSALQPLPNLSVQSYNPSYDKDRFDNTALTINGRIDGLKFVYTGSYLVRNVREIQDYTNYARGFFADYYQCTGGGTSASGAKSQCFSPSATWHDTEKNTHQSHEMRLSTPDDWRMRAIGGLFWEDYLIHEQTDWFYGSPQAGFEPIAPPPGTTDNNHAPRPPGDNFFDDITRGYKQKAVFGSIDYDIIPKVLTITAGTRWYDFQNTEVGASAGSFGCRPGGVYSPPVVLAPCLADSSNLNAQNLENTYAGFKSRANISWKITPEDLLYYTWSQGFRPGGFNRRSYYNTNDDSFVGHTVPESYAPDTLTNNELGWKTQWLDRHLEFNGTIYQENWLHTQISIFDPNPAFGLGNQTFTANGPDYRVRGVETQLTWLIVRGLTITGAAAWNSSTETSNPLPGVTVANPFGDIGSPLAQCPPFEGNLRARYEFPIMEYHGFVQIGGTRQAHSYASTDRISVDLQGNSIAYDQPAFSTWDASVGVAKDAWTAQFYGTNLSNTQADLFSSYSQFVKANTINVPRTVGLKVSYRFGGT